MINRRNAIEHIKMDGCFASNLLKGALGGALYAVMCGAGQNLRLILAALRLYCARAGLSIHTVIAALSAALSDRDPSSAEDVIVRDGLNMACVPFCGYI